MHLLGFLLAAALAAEPYGGVEWRPLSRSDLAWVGDGLTSGAAVGEFDGAVRPSLQAHAGAWLGRRLALGGSIGVARMQQTARSHEVWRQRHRGVVRPSLDLRLALAEAAPRRATPWLLLGAHADLPSARDVSNGYTDEEQRAADRAAAAERRRLGGFGGRVGIGAEYPVTPGVAIGASYALQWHRTAAFGDDFASAGQWLVGEGSLWLLFRWPREGTERPRRAAVPDASSLDAGSAAASDLPDRSGGHGAPDNPLLQAVGSVKNP